MENFIISTNNIWSDQWSDPVYFDFYGIDPSIFFDDDGKSYIHGSSWRSTIAIGCFEIDLRTGRNLTPERKIFDGSLKVIPEGPHMYKKDGYYYLLIAEGGTHTTHQLSIARSQDIWGPYESYTENPILRPAHERTVQYTGHGDFFMDKQGAWWMVCLGVRKSGQRYILGRETFLSPVTWPVNEWPIIPPIDLNLPESSSLPTERDSSTPSPSIDFLQLRDADLDGSKISQDGQKIVLKTKRTILSQTEGPVAFVAKRQRTLKGRSSVTLNGTYSNTKAGLAYFKDEHRFASVGYDFSSFQIVFEFYNAAKSISQVSHIDEPSHSPISFQIDYTDTTLKFSYSTKSSEMVVVGTIDTADFSDDDFTGPIIGVFATSEQEEQSVEFTELQIE
jgi:beta-xylosidase